MQIETLQKQIYVLEKKLVMGSNGRHNFPLINKINNLKKQLNELKRKISWETYLAK